MISIGRNHNVRVSLATRIILSIGFVVLIVLGYFSYQWFTRSGERGMMLRTWFQDPDKHKDWAISSGEICGSAPFAMPTSGYIGFMWDDSFRPGHRHQGLDIFGGDGAGVTPIFAAYDGYLSRMPDWKSSVIIRIPSDPLRPSHQIWTYYTHMATQGGESFIANEFPPGTTEVFVETGTLLGFQGNYSGDPNNPTGIHLHFSIVLDDENATFRNELKIQNTLDPSPYLGLPLNAQTNKGEIAVCQEDPL